ncbi:hypothetical protein IAU59_007647 [Kwoniella sp. CBS 9459]
MPTYSDYELEPNLIGRCHRIKGRDLYLVVPKSGLIADATWEPVNRRAENCFSFLLIFILPLYPIRLNNHQAAWVVDWTSPEFAEISPGNPLSRDMLATQFPQFCYMATERLRICLSGSDPYVQKALCSMNNCPTRPLILTPEAHREEFRQSHTTPLGGSLLGKAAIVMDDRTIVYYLAMPDGGLEGSTGASYEPRWLEESTLEEKTARHFTDDAVDHCGVWKVSVDPLPCAKRTHLVLLDLPNTKQLWSSHQQRILQQLESQVAPQLVTAGAELLPDVAGTERQTTVAMGLKLPDECLPCVSVAVDEFTTLLHTPDNTMRSLQMAESDRNVTGSLQSNASSPNAQRGGFIRVRQSSSQPSDGQGRTQGPTIDTFQAEIAPGDGVDNDHRNVRLSHQDESFGHVTTDRKDQGPLPLHEPNPATSARDYTSSPTQGGRGSFALRDHSDSEDEFSPNSITSLWTSFSCPLSVSRSTQVGNGGDYFEDNRRLIPVPREKTITPSPPSPLRKGVTRKKARISDALYTTCIAPDPTSRSISSSPVTDADVDEVAVGPVNIAVDPSYEPMSNYATPRSPRLQAAGFDRFDPDRLLTPSRRRIPSPTPPPFRPCLPSFVCST